MNKETAKEFALRIFVTTVSCMLMMSEIKALFFMGMMLLCVSSMLRRSERQVAQMFPGLLIGLFVFMLVALGEVIAPVQGIPLALRYHHVLAFALFGIWTIGMIWEYRKWRTTNSEK